MPDECDKVEITVRGAYELGQNPWPIAFVRIDGQLHDFYLCGTVHRRVKWLPLWLPFNTRICTALTSQAACVQMLREKHTAIWNAIHGEK